MRHAARGHGSEHGGDPEACRRDRRKDQLLQEHGYFVRRFLAEDVRKCFDQVLDPILRVFRRKLATAARPPLMG